MYIERTSTKVRAISIEKGMKVIGLLTKCRRRGMTCWKCRTRNFVSYQDSAMESIQNLVSVFVIITLGEFVKQRGLIYKYGGRQ